MPPSTVDGAHLSAGNTGQLAKSTMDSFAMLSNGKSARPMVASFGPTQNKGQNKGQNSLKNSYSYTIAAARRSEKRRLLCFVRMVDYMSCSVLKEVGWIVLFDLHLLDDNGWQSGLETYTTITTIPYIPAISLALHLL